MSDRTQPCIEQRILDSLGWGVMVVGRWSRVIRSFNRRMAEITGLDARTVVGRSVMEVFGQLRGLDFEALDAEIRRTGRFEARNLRLVRPDGEVIYRHLRGDVLEADEDDDPGVVVSMQDVTEHAYLRWSMTRYLAREVADLVLAGREERPIEGREVEAAVLVADMRDFTAAAEGLTPQELFETLNAYLAPMVEVVIGHRGMIDKFTGDGFMALFGVPEPGPDDAGRAVAAAWALRRAVARVTDGRAARGLPVAALGYGVHWGTVMAGTIGGEQRMEFTVVGDTVNVAHRVQQLAGPGEILVTRPAARAAGPGYRWGPDRWVRIRGRKAPVKLAPLEDVPVRPASGPNPSRGGGPMSVAAFVQALEPIFQRLDSLGSAGPDAIRDDLARAFPLDCPEVRQIRELFTRGVDEGWLCGQEAGGARFSRVARPSDATAGYSVDAVRLAGPGVWHGHPGGEIDLCLARDPGATFDGHGEGWVVFGPDSAHVPTVAGGTMDIVYFLPGGAIDWKRPRP